MKPEKGSYVPFWQLQKALYSNSLRSDLKSRETTLIRNKSNGAAKIAHRGAGGGGCIGRIRELRDKQTDRGTQHSVPDFEHFRRR